jgi:hypothetical protein
MNDRETNEARGGIGGCAKGVLLTISALLLLAVLAWTIDSPPASAQPNGAGVGVKDYGPASQRAAMLKAQKRTNELLEELVGLLKEGKAKVQVVEPEKPAQPKPSKGGSRVIFPGKK